VATRKYWRWVGRSRSAFCQRTFHTFKMYSIVTITCKLFKQVRVQVGLKSISQSPVSERQLVLIQLRPWTQSHNTNRDLQYYIQYSTPMKLQQLIVLEPYLNNASVSPFIFLPSRFSSHNPLRTKVTYFLDEALNVQISMITRCSFACIKRS
jgi:hypothetical protein